MKFLIVEDNEDHFWTLKRFIVECGLYSVCQVDGARSLEEAVAAVGQTGYNLIFLDLTLPDSNSLESIRTLKDAAPDVPVVVVTSHGVEELGVDSLRFGAIDFVNKMDLNRTSVRTIIRYALERQQIQSELIRARSEAQNAANAKSAFLANMSHEIRTPLNLIVGAADLLRESQLTPEQRRLVRTFHSASDHLLALIDNILDVSSIEAIGLNCSDSPFDLEECFSEACDIVGFVCESKNLLFDYRIGKIPTGSLIGDRRRVRQVMLNLLNNAVKFTDSGSVNFSVDYSPAADGGESGVLRLSVRDTGCGIPESDRSKIFDGFFQGESGLTRGFSGTGLGLAIVKTIVEHYHGEITVNSELGQGTEVTVTLNLPMATAPEDEEKPLMGRRIFFVSEATLERETVGNMLEFCGATVELSGSLDEVLAKGPLAEVDFIVVDHNATSALGTYIAQEALPHEIAHRMLILMPTLRSQPAIDYWERKGISRFIYKPFTVAKFNEAAFNKRLVSARKSMAMPPLRVLVVDDDRDNLDLVKAYLAPESVEPEFAESGLKAMEMVENKNFDVILMDIEMPDLSGYDTAVRMMSGTHLGDTKILGLSANALTEHVERAKACGFSGYLTKPIRKETLLRALYECRESDRFCQVY
jgi:signal transduction histidine kinase